MISGQRDWSTGRPRVKICCISDPREALLAIRLGASALGLVSKMPSGPGVIDEDLIAEIVDSIPPGVSSFLLTSLREAEAIVEQQRRCRANTLQICDRPRSGTHRTLRSALPGISIVQVIHVNGKESISEAREVSREVDALLLDSGNQSLQVKQLGGTGRTHDWTVSRRIVEEVDVPVFLAGGLQAGNVGEAVSKVRPFGLDVCSGVRRGGRLSEAKLREFMLSAFAER